MADKNTNHQKREIFELKLINSLLLKEVSKSNNEINSTNFDNEIVEITQLKKLNSILVKELAESRNEIDKLKCENEILKSEQGSKNTSKNFLDNQKNRKRKKPNSSTNLFSNPTSNNDFENEAEKEQEQENFIENKILPNISHNNVNNETFEKNESLMDTSEKVLLDEQDLELHFGTAEVYESKKNEEVNTNIEKFAIENVHDKKQPKNVCHICNQKLYDASSKKKHLLKMHDIETHYSCEKCDQSFSIFNNLQIHKREHIKKVAWQNYEKCDVCDKKISKKRMSSHMSEHLDLYKCNECDLSFIRAELNKHIDNVHKPRESKVSSKIRGVSL